MKNGKMIFKLSCKIEFFVPYNGHKNCLDKSLGTFTFVQTIAIIELISHADPIALFLTLNLY